MPLLIKRKAHYFLNRYFLKKLILNLKIPRNCVFYYCYILLLEDLIKLDLFYSHTRIVSFVSETFRFHHQGAEQSLHNFFQNF